MGDYPVHDLAASAQLVARLNVFTALQQFFQQLGLQARAITGPKLRRTRGVK